MLCIPCGQTFGPNAAYQVDAFHWGKGALWPQIWEEGMARKTMQKKVTRFVGYGDTKREMEVPAPHSLPDPRDEELSYSERMGRFNRFVESGRADPPR